MRAANDSFEAIRKEILRAGTVLASEVIQIVGTQLAEDTWTRLRGLPELQY